MPRWEPGGAARLQDAAFDLFEEHGYEGTNVSDIAARAGLSQRSFYTHFTDKREVLFGLSAQYEQEVLAALAKQADPLSLDLVVAAMQDAGDTVFQEHRPAVIRRQAIVATAEDLREREAAKHAALSSAIVQALRERDVDEESAAIIAGAALLVQQIAFVRWAATDALSLKTALAAALEVLRAAV